MGWTVTFETAGHEPTGLEAALEEFLHLLVDRGGAVTGSAIGDRYGATFSIEEAATAPDAVAFGYEIFSTYAEKSGLPAWPVVRAEALTFEELDRDLETPNFPELVGVSEIAELLGVSRQRASAVAKRADFPTPIASLASGPVWTRPSLNRFVDEWPRKEGRPPKLRTLARNLIREIGDPTVPLSPGTLEILATSEEVIADRPYVVLIHLAEALSNDLARVQSENQPAEHIAVVQGWLDETVRTMSGYSMNSQ
jgi:hypothetical protein